MTTRTHRRMKGLLPPRRPRTVTTYGVHLLDGTRGEYALDREQKHREAIADDPWLSPEKSEAVQALLVLIEFAQAHTYSTAYTPADDLDVRGFCEDAGLTAKQLEVVLMVGEGWAIGAIAIQLGITRQAVSLRLHYGRRKLVRQVLPLDRHLQKAYCGGDELHLNVG